MASLTSKALVCLGRINVSALGLQKPVNIVTYATEVSVNSSVGNTGEFVVFDSGPGRCVSGRTYSCTLS